MCGCTLPDRRKIGLGLHQTATRGIYLQMPVPAITHTAYFTHMEECNSELESLRYKYRYVLFPEVLNCLPRRG